MGKVKKEVMRVIHNAKLGEELNGSHHRCAYSVGTKNTEIEASVDVNKNWLMSKNAKGAITQEKQAKSCVCLCYGKSYLQAEQPRHTSDKTTDQTKFGMKNQKKNDHKNSGQAESQRVLGRRGRHVGPQHDPRRSTVPPHDGQ